MAGIGGESPATTWRARPRWGRDPAAGRAIRPGLARFGRCGFEARGPAEFPQLRASASHVIGPA